MIRLQTLLCIACCQEAKSDHVCVHYQNVWSKTIWIYVPEPTQTRVHILITIFSALDLQIRLKHPWWKESRGGPLKLTLLLLTAIVAPYGSFVKSQNPRELSFYSSLTEAPCFVLNVAVCALKKTSFSFTWVTETTEWMTPCFRSLVNVKDEQMHWGRRRCFFFQAQDTWNDSRWEDEKKHGSADVTASVWDELWLKWRQRGARREEKSFNGTQSGKSQNVEQAGLQTVVNVLVNILLCCMLSNPDLWFNEIINFFDLLSAHAPWEEELHRNNPNNYMLDSFTDLHISVFYQKLLLRQCFLIA